MKYFVVLLLFLGCLSFSATSKRQYPDFDTTNMVLLKQTTFLMGIDSAQLQEDVQRFNLPVTAF